jgi:hypothetical protein
MKNKRYFELLSWIRSSLLGHILIFGLVAGGGGAVIFGAFLRTEGPFSLVSFLELCIFLMFCTAAIGVLFWFSVTSPALKRKQEINNKSDN